MVPESPLESTEYGLVPTGAGWFVMNARDAPWYASDRRAALRHSAGVQQETTDPDEAYARFGPSKRSRYRDGWLS